MPRTGGVYNAPAGTKGIPNTTIQSAPYNALVDDLVQDANAARPITAGGTGATNATDARLNIGALASADLLAAPTKAVPVDNDGMVITDSEDTGKIKRVLWSVIKDKLKAFFDGFYQPLLSTVSAIELNNALTVNADAYIDFHSSFPIIDYDLRIIRRPGLNGNAEIVQNGTGQMRFIASAGSYFDNGITVNGPIKGIGAINVQAVGSAANAHFYMYAEDGATVRGIIYANTSKQMIIGTNGNTQAFTFGTDGQFYAPNAINAGTAQLATNGNVIGSSWIGGNINAHIENRAAAYASDAKNSCVTDSRMAGEINIGIFIMDDVYRELHNSGYVLTRVWHVSNGGLNFGSRQPQLYIANRGWYAAFNF